MKSKIPIIPPTENIPTTEVVTPPPVRNLIPLISLCVLIILLGALAIFFERVTNVSWMQDVAYTLLGKKNPNVLLPPTEPSAPTPTSSYLPPGKQTYAISSQSKGPKVSSITLEPLDIHKGDNQKISVKTSKNDNVTETIITIFSDKKKTILPLTYSENEWTTSWIVNDTVNTRYIFRIEATNSSTTSSTLVAPRTSGPIRLNQLK
ncbi:hypothetical protein KBC80_03270 [Candidatus Woesebacteria bacterium]|nr:hypothetical protein [Candidatus Woesebacteria bacterium]